MNNFRPLLIIFMLSILALEGRAQSPQVKFTLLKGTDGVTLGKINGMTRDRFGFMWFSDQTNRCIIRYDGAHMVRFQYESKKPEGLGGYYPECLFADTIGNIWIGFYDGAGVDRYDPVTNTFTHFRHNPNDPGSLSPGSVSVIRVDHLGNLWVGSNNGLDRLDNKTGKFIHYRYDPDDSTSLSYNIVRAIYEDRQGTLWIGTGDGYSNDPEGGLNQFDRKAGTFKRYLRNPDNPRSLIDNAVRAIFEDSKGNFWVGTRGNGLHLMDKAKGTFKQFRNDSRQPEQLSAPPVKSSNSFVTFITEDAAENLWIGTNDNGLNRYDPSTEKITHYGNNADRSDSFSDNSGWWIHNSPDGLIWLSTQESNLFQIDIFNTTIPFVTRSGFSISALFDAPSTLWLGTTEGLIREDLQNKTIQHFQHNPQIKQSLSGNAVTAIYKDRYGIIWVGTNDGLSRLDPGTLTFSNYVNIPGDSLSLGNNYVLTLYEDSDSVLWVATFNGLQQLDRKAGRFKTYLNSYTSLFFEDRQKFLWLGSDYNNGITRVNRATGERKSYLPGLSIFNYYLEKDTIWLATQNGLYRYDRPSDSFSPLEESNSRLQINASIFSIVNDKEGNLWMSSSSGIIKLENKRDRITLYGKDNGVNPEFFRGGTACIDNDGRLYFLGQRGYFVFHPEKLNRLASNPNPHFTALWMEGKIVNPGPESLLHFSLNDTREIQLAYNQNTFDLGFTTVDFRNSQQENINYLLENYDAGWRLSNTENRASYFKVPPGHYKFRIKIANAEDASGNEKSILIHIAPPWWRSGWAYGFYGLAFVTGIFLIDRAQRRRIREKERALAREKELSQAHEIEKAYVELKATQKQLIQSEKMASLGELTAGIAHEIQNPLNFVNNFSEVNAELIEEMEHEIDKGNFADAKAIGKNIKENQEKISHHGKRADAIVKGMLQHSRSSNGVKEPTDINALTDEYLRLAYHGLRAKDKSFNAMMKTEYDENIGKVNIVPQDIGRVILNLITNAFYAVSEKSAFAKASADEKFEPTVSVSTKSAGDKVVIRVKDNGNGIPQKVLDKIFQPFFTTKPAGQGTGLGLSMSYDIVKAHGGELKVETKQGEGAEFIIMLPV